jgi:flavin reductase (DIM6/NTAB) family NADH-FMN oxidoreductase RutF
LVSGKKVDKSTVFTSFYGKLETAPMIDQCPITMECELINTIDFPDHDLFIGKLVETYCDESCLIDGTIDIRKVQPILYLHRAYSESGTYWTIGEPIAKAWDVGKDLIQH